MVEVKPSSPSAISGPGAVNAAPRRRAPAAPASPASCRSGRRRRRRPGPGRRGRRLSTWALAMTSSRWRRLSKTSSVSLNMKTASGKPEVVARRARQPLHVPHHVVGEVAHRAALESGQAGNRDRAGTLRAALRSASSGLPSGRRWGGVSAAEGDATVLRREDHQRVRAEERVASPDLAALDGLQEKRVGSRPEPQIGGQRRVQVRRELGKHRARGSPVPARMRNSSRVGDSGGTAYAGGTDAKPSTTRY